MISLKEKIRQGLHMFKRALFAIKYEILISLLILVVATIVFTMAMYLAEHPNNPQFTIWKSLSWTVATYIKDSGGVFFAPTTTVGKIVGALVGLIGIAIYAVPAGLLGTGLMNAIAEEKKADRLRDFRRRINKSFRRLSDNYFREYLNAHKDSEIASKITKANFVPQCRNIAKIQTRQGMSVQDVIDTCNYFPELRIKNLADAKGKEAQMADCFIVEHFPLNRSYGCRIKRKSKVTILCTSSFDEVGIGWFTYYLAKFGDFNYISKEVEVDVDELDSYLNWSEKPLYDKKTKEEYDKKKDKTAYEILEKKEKYRKEFMDDLEEAISCDGAWVIVMTEHIKSSENKQDFHFANTLSNGSGSTITDIDAYEAFLEAFDLEMKDGKNDYLSDKHSNRYSLKKKNICYVIRKKKAECNAFVLRASSELMNFDDRKLVVALRMAQVISKHFDDNRGITEEEAKDLASTGFGYKENNIKKEDNKDGASDKAI